MSDFSDRPFAAGSLTGVRSFKVDPLGRLTGVTFEEVFKPGENVARHGSLSSVAPYRFTVETTNTARVARRPHEVGAINCACGFYAYFDGTNDYYGRERVTAVVEGYGLCTVGDRGFRAEKARLVALIDPTRRSRSRSLHAVWDKVADASEGAEWLFIPGSVVAGLAATGFAFVALPWSLLLLVLAALLIGFAIFGVSASLHSVSRQHPDVSPEVQRCAILPPRWRTRHSEMARVISNYPGVPIYPTLAAALRDHPLTPPPEEPPPTPESHEDFWEMEVPR